MNKMRAIVTLVAMSIAWTSSYAGYWRDSDGRPTADTASRRTVEGFGGWVLVTPDQDWAEKWNTPAESVPSFRESKSVRRGEKVFTLIFFANPKLAQDRSADVTCDLKVTRPNGTESLNQRDVPCFRGRIAGDPFNMYLSGPVIGFIGEPGDPAGTWTVEVQLKDNLRKVVVPLKTSFDLE
jgi:hypothetical protein